jgi:hypothetical protein
MAICVWPHICNALKEPIGDWSKNLTASLIVAAKVLNVAGMSDADRLHQLCTDAISGILLVTHIPALDGVVQMTFITVLDVDFYASARSS